MPKSPNNYIDRGKEALAVGVSAALFATLGAVAAKASTTSEKKAIKSSVPHLVPSGLGPKQPLTEFLSSSAERDPYAYAAMILAARDKGPLEENVIDNGAILLTSGAVVYKAPIEGAIDHIVPKRRFALWSFSRLVPVGDTLWAVAWDRENGAYYDQVSDPRGDEWVKVPKDNTATFRHLVPMDYNPDKSSNYQRTFSVQVIPDSTSRLRVVSVGNVPEELLDWRNIASRYEDSTKYQNKYGWQFGATSVIFIPTKTPVRFIKAKVPTYQGSGE